MKKIVSILSALLLFAGTGLSRTTRKAKIDSLKFVLTKATGDSPRSNLLLEV